MSMKPGTLCCEQTRINSRVWGCGSRNVTWDAETQVVECLDCGLTHRLDRIGNDCDGCADCKYAGVRWPSTHHDDSTQPWVERCDYCELFENDDEAAKYIAQFEQREVLYGTPHGSQGSYPYVYGLRRMMRA